MGSKKPTWPQHAACLTATSVIALLAALALIGCGATKSAMPTPTGTQFVEQEQKVDNSECDESRQVDSDSGFRAGEKRQSPSNKTSAAYTKLEKGLGAKLSNYGDRVAVAVVSANGDDSIAINGNKRFVSASMIKLLILAEFIDEIDAGKLSLSDVYSSKREDIVGGTGVIQSDPIGTKYTFDDLARHMIADSDNTASNVLIDAMGIDTINAKASELGLEKTALNRKMMDLRSGVENYISANDAAKILIGIATGKLGSKRMCKKAMGYLEKQTDNAGLAQGLPNGTVFAHKTGSLSSIRHDGGVVECESPYTIVVLTEIGTQTANELMKSVASTTYQLLRNR